MKSVENMTREELMEVIRIKDSLIRELREEIEAYRQLVRELMENYGKKI
ncbi:MAG: hypothetical protein QHH06_09905 [Clostridiales bacterium]|jgi:hypothetical protein|nr:hypothetical protein [Eubacteriales bacterium]MDH7566778.1 hypothetical protein [Clostridiales bacterium]